MDRFYTKTLGYEAKPQVVELLSQAMAHNPLHIAALGKPQRKRVKRLAVILEPLAEHVFRQGRFYGINQDQKLIATLGLLPPKHCQPSLATKLAITAKIFFRMAPAYSIKSSYWLARWAKQDLKRPHWHLGPMAVAPKFRRQGMAKSLMQKALEQCVDAPAWLETDTRVNADFYARLGFRTHLQTRILGVEQWFMSRSADNLFE